MGEFVSIRASAGVRSGADTICGSTLPFMEGVVVASAVALCCRVSSSWLFRHLLEQVPRPHSPVPCPTFSTMISESRTRGGINPTPRQYSEVRLTFGYLGVGCKRPHVLSPHFTRGAERREYYQRRFTVHSGCRLRALNSRSPE